MDYEKWLKNPAVVPAGTHNAAAPDTFHELLALAEAVRISD